MSRYLKLARPFLVVVLIFAAIRFSFLPQGVPYDNGRAQAVSLVVLTLLGTAFHAAFARRWLRFGIAQCMGLGFTFGVLAQLVILLATLLSYLTGTPSFFNHPEALGRPGEVGLGTAMGIRLGGLVVNSITASIAGAIGWALGALLPERE
jgi:hypothetical protein